MFRSSQLWFDGAVSETSAELKSLDPTVMELLTKQQLPHVERMMCNMKGAGYANVEDIEVVIQAMVRLA